MAGLFIDDRAGSRDLMKLEPVRSIGELTRLDSGDAMLVGNGPDDAPTLIGVEVKSIWDLVGSMNTGRLQATQVPAMLQTYDVCWLLYYGSYRPTYNGMLEIRRNGSWVKFKIGQRQVPYGYIESFLFDLTVIGLRVKYAYDLFEAAQWLGVLHRWWSKPWSKHHGMRTLDKSRDLSLMPGMDGATHLRACVASQLPGVGFERAISAARHFGSVRDMVNADEDEWARVDGIGRVIARAVVSAVK